MQELTCFCLILRPFIFLILVQRLVNKELSKIKEGEKKSIFLSI